VGTILVTAIFQVAIAIFLESFLSFIGLGVAAPMASLGSLCSGALGGITSYPYLLVFPAILISLIILSFNLMGDGLRDALDPRLRGN
jgi:oligopeptide transport system permease protein